MTLRPTAIALVSAALLLSSGCSILPESEPATLYRLPSSDIQPVTSDSMTTRQRLAVAAPQAGHLLSSNRIVVYPEGNVVNVYEAARWQENAPALLQSRLIEGLQQVAGLPDPVGEIGDMRYRPSGIQVGKMRVPLGVIGIIYESRPNVTLEAASLCLKSGNACILRGGSEASQSNAAISACIQTGLADVGLPAGSVQVVATTDRAAVGEMISMPEYVDVIIPRGGKSLIERISRDARVPVIKHLDGVCHVYIDTTADPAKALAIAVNAKTHRYGTCNTMETLLVDAPIADLLLPELARAYAEHEVELRGCQRTQALLPQAAAAEEADWYAEYLAPVLAIKVVDGIDEAIAHIEQYGSHHTDAIVTQDYSLARRFMAEVDSSSVIVNASTRFADGFEYGLGAEIGISTDKLHARGPVGLEGLTTQKYVVFGDGQVRE